MINRNMIYVLAFLNPNIQFHAS
uniref:Uncharacterized protein n=1 Tax=Anguilla anguilla TaxID=7936 RepID=A0A0E9RKU7_ANGAN